MRAGHVMTGWRAAIRGALRVADLHRCRLVGLHEVRWRGRQRPGQVMVEPAESPGWARWGDLHPHRAASAVMPDPEDPARPATYKTRGTSGRLDAGDPFVQPGYLPSSPGVSASGLGCCYETDLPPGSPRIRSRVAVRSPPTN